MTSSIDRRQFLTKTGTASFGAAFAGTALSTDLWSEAPGTAPNAPSKQVAHSLPHAASEPVNASVPHPKLPDRAPEPVHAFPMRQVKLDPGPFLTALETNRRYLHALPNDRLAHMFELTAGRPSNAQPFG